MSLTQINLKPYWDENTIERMELSPSYTIEPTIVGGGENIKNTHKIPAKDLNW